MDDPESTGIRVGDLRPSDMEAAGWGASWVPDSLACPRWPDAEEEQDPDAKSYASQPAWEAWPIFERIGVVRRLLAIA